MTEGKLREILAELEVEVTGKNSGGWLVCRCPFAPDTHDGGRDKNPSCFVKIEPSGNSGFNCLTCKEKGPLRYMAARLGYFREKEEAYQSIQNRIMRYEFITDHGDFEDIPDTYDEPRPISEQLMAGVLRLPEEVPPAMEYLAGRGITPEAAETIGLMVDDGQEKRVVFPVRDFAGNLYGYSGRSYAPDTYRPYTNYRKVKDYAGLPKDRMLLGEHLIDPTRPLLVVEGLMAFAHMVSIGAREICNPVATMGSSLSTHQRDKISMHDLPTYMLYDDDEAGDIGLFGRKDKKTGAHVGGGAVDMLKEFVPTYLALYPDDKADPDDFDFNDVRKIIEGDNKSLCS